jgi:hypothetical protein
MINDKLRMRTILDLHHAQLPLCPERNTNLIDDKGIDRELVPVDAFEFAVEVGLLGLGVPVFHLVVLLGVAVWDLGQFELQLYDVVGAEGEDHHAAGAV